MMEANAAYSQEEMRRAVLAKFVSLTENSERSKLMKYMYLLQTVYGKNLGYKFRLRNYGPYDEQVFFDLDSAINFGLIKSKLVTDSIGYDYQLSLASELDENINNYTESLNESFVKIIKKFGNESTSRMELISTIVFALCDKNKKLSNQDLVDKVYEIKSHFTKEQIQKTVEDLSKFTECVDCSG